MRKLQSDSMKSNEIRLKSRTTTIWLRVRVKLHHFRPAFIKWLEFVWNRKTFSYVTIICIYNECVIPICSFKISKQLRVGNRLHGYSDLVSKIPIHLCNCFGGHKFIVWLPTSQRCLIQMRLSQWLRVIYLNNVIHCWCNESCLCAIDISHLKALIFWEKIAWKN